MPAALVPRPWDFPTPPEKLNLSSPAVREPEEEPAEGEEEDEFSEVPSPAQSRPNSPPILLPPLPQHEPVSFAPNTAPPIDDTPVEITSEVDEDVPDVNVIPPAPPAAETLSGVPKEIEVVAV